MKKIIRHIKNWNIWRKRNANGRIHHILVLLGIIKSPTMLEMIEKQMKEGGK